jgi:bifunctional DNA-binding transcriptional regulator/antitoxin component of YhaV-PrlF toxin-antitoxin module
LRPPFCGFTVLLLRGYTLLMNTPSRHRYLGVQGRGTIALPADVRRRLHLDQPGAQLEMTERADGVIELRAALPVPAEQAWFWTERWQEREREVDEHVAAHRVTVHDSTDDFLSHLAALDAE